MQGFVAAMAPDLVLLGILLILQTEWNYVVTIPTLTSIAKKNVHRGNESPYVTIPQLLPFCDAFERCIMDIKCSSFSTEVKQNKTFLYAFTDQPPGDFVIWNDLCSFTEGNIYSREHNYCIYLSKREKKNYFDARTECQSTGADLVSLQTKGKFDEVTKLLLSYTPENYWLGGRRNGVTFLWLSGEEVDSSFWAEGEPNNENDEQDTVKWWDERFLLDDDNSYSEYYFICEY